MKVLIVGAGIGGDFSFGGEGERPATEVGGPPHLATLATVVPEKLLADDDVAVERGVEAVVQNLLIPLQKAVAKPTKVAQKLGETDHWSEEGW